MKNFNVEEQVTEDGVKLVIEALNGLTFEDGSTVMEVVPSTDRLPRAGQRVMCGGRLIKVKERKFNSAGTLMLFDEDMKEWCLWES